MLDGDTFCFYHLQEAQSCNIPLSLHLEIEWTKYGSLVNPQAQIVSIREMIETNQSSLVRLTSTSTKCHNAVRHWFEDY